MGKKVLLLIVLVLCTSTFAATSRSVVESSSCFDNSNEWAVYDWENCYKGFSNQSYIKKICMLYQQAKSQEDRGDIEKSLIGYHTVNIAMQKTGPMPFMPAEKAMFRINYLGLYKEEHLTATHVLFLYQYLGNGLICETLKRKYKSLKESVGPNNKELIDTIAIAESNIELMESLVSQKKIIVYSKLGFAIVGRKQLELWTEALFDTGIKFEKDKWEVFDPTNVPEWKKETKGILKNCAFSLGSASFVPGLKVLYKKAGIDYKETDLYDNIWEYSLISHDFDEIQSNTLTLFDTGKIFEKIGQHEKAIEYYSKSAKTNIGVHEPLLRLYGMNVLKDPLEKEIASAILKRIEKIDKIRKDLKRFKKTDSLRASLFHTYLVRNIVLGRVLVASLPSQREKPAFQIIDTVFFKDWIEGMENYGVLLKKDSIRVIPVTDKQQLAPLHPLKGFWQGCFKNKDDLIFVPGFFYFK